MHEAVTVGAIVWAAVGVLGMMAFLGVLSIIASILLDMFKH